MFCKRSAERQRIRCRPSRKGPPQLVRPYSRTAHVSTPRARSSRSPILIDSHTQTGVMVYTTEEPDLCKANCLSDSLCHGFVVQTSFKVCKFYGGKTSASSVVHLKEAATDTPERMLYLLHGLHP